MFNTERKKLLAANPEKYQTETGIDEVKLTRDTMQVIQQILRGFYAEGGRVGLMAGGGADMGANKVTETATTPEPQKIDFETLRARLPKEIGDDIVRLIATSPEALEDFATIQTQQDVDTFNKKYDVNLVLPAEA